MPETGYPGDVVVRGLLDRDVLIERLDRALTKRVTVISAPAGSGKTSLLRAWADRGLHSVAFVSVERDEHNAERFWSAVLCAIRGCADSSDPDRIAALASDELAERVASELA